MEYFVKKGSIVRKIWGKSDTVLFIFAGASAEFALNKAVDWLYYTGRLPSDPLGRLFSTVAYAHRIIYLPYSGAVDAIDNITAVHTGLEKKRGQNIPQWAYRDVLYMLIAYSIRVYELLEQPLKEEQKEEVYDVFYRVGLQMKIENLPANYKEWLHDREQHLNQNLKNSNYTIDLYQQYKKHLGSVRYWLLIQSQKLICPPKVCDLLGLKNNPILSAALAGYKLSRLLQMDKILKLLFLPGEYKEQIRELDRNV